MWSAMNIIIGSGTLHFVSHSSLEKSGENILNGVKYWYRVSLILGLKLSAIHKWLRQNKTITILAVILTKVLVNSKWSHWQQLCTKPYWATAARGLASPEVLRDLCHLSMLRQWFYEGVCGRWQSSNALLAPTSHMHMDQQCLLNLLLKHKVPP